MWYNIVVENETFGYREQSGSWRGVVPASAILPGWTIRGLYAVAGGISLLEFAKGEDRATWFLDENMQRLGGSIHELSGERLDQLKGQFTSVVEDLYHSVFVDKNPVGVKIGAAFLEVQALTRYEVATACLLGSEMLPFEDAGAATCRFRHMKEALCLDFQDAIIAGAANQAVEFIDPSDGLPCLVKHSIALDDFRYIYLLRSRSGDTFWVCVSEHYARIICIFDQSRGDVYAFSQHNKNVGQALFGKLHSDLRTIAAEFGDVLPLYFQATQTRIASLLRPPPANHLGHQLWNELSGIQFAVDRLPRAHLPFIVVPAANRGTETFGPTENLFPELHRKVVRWPVSIDFRRHAIISGFTLIKLAQRKVTKELRARLNVRVASHPNLDSDREQLGRYLEQGRNIIVIGLRVENRTLTDLESFVRNLTRRCSEWFPGIVIVLDGHNSQISDGGEIILASHGQWGAKRQPIDVERELGNIVRAESHERDIEFINLIGQPVDRSLFWSFHSDCFVTIWGAGLAKYRWVANSPGIVITSAWNRLHRSDLHIYSSDQFMDSPENMEFVSPDDVRDQPDAEQLVKFNSDQQPESYSNFSLTDMDQMRFLKVYLERNLGRH